MSHPFFKRTALPTRNPARELNGRIVRPVRGFDQLLIGIFAVTPLNARSQRRDREAIHHAHNNPTDPVRSTLL